MNLDSRIRERTAAMHSSKHSTGAMSMGNTAVTTTSSTSMTTNRRHHPPKRTNHQTEHTSRKTACSGSPSNGNAHRKRKKSRVCGGKVLVLASAALFLMLLHAIAFARYIYVYNYDVNPKKSSYSHRSGYESAGLTKEEERDRLQKLQQEKMGKIMQRKKVRNRDYEENLDEFLKEKKIASFQRKYPKMIHFLHIHKSAGTFLCKQAFQNKLAIDRKRNCNVRDDQKCCWYDDNKKSWNEKIDTNDESKLLQQSIQFAENAPFDFVATERELAGPMLTDHYDYVVTLRDSKSRYESHWKHLVRNAKQRKKEVERYQKRKGNRNGKDASIAAPHRSGYLVSGQKKNPNTPKDSEAPWGLGGKNNIIVGPRTKWANTGDDPEVDPVHWNLTVVNPSDGSIHPVGNFTKWIDGQPDNYSLRMICGTKCLNTPKYQITKDLFEYSLEKLWVNFSHILFVEDMEASYARFASAYGWTGLENKKSKKKKSSNDNRNSSSFSLSLSLSTAYGDSFLTVLDDAMYEFARRKYYNATAKNISSLQKPDYAPFENQIMVDAYFREGPTRNCTNPCCGYCSKW